MWSEVEQKAKLLEKQRETPSVTYNIINYSEPHKQDLSKESIEAEVEENKQEVQKSLENLDKFNIIDYNLQ